MTSQLFALIKERNWDDTKLQLQSIEDQPADFLQERHEANLTCFDLAVCLKAPPEVLEEMIKFDKSLPTMRDSYGLTALHIGCLNGAPLTTVKILLQDNMQLASGLDHDHRCPLHHAVEYACCSATGDGDFYIDVLQSLCLAAPDMVHAQDKVGVTPIDLVQDAKADTEADSLMFQKLDIVYKVLSVTSIYVYRTNKREWEKKSVTLQHVLNILQNK